MMVLATSIARRSLRVFGLATFVSLALVMLAVPANAQINTTTTLDSATTQTGRILRNGEPHSCAAPKTFAGPNDTSPGRAYDSYSYVNSTASTQCVEITLEQGSSFLFAVAYLGSFNPADPNANWLGDPGSSTPTASFSVDVPAGQTLVVVVHEVGVGGGVGQTYTLSVTPPAPEPIPTLSEFALILLAFMLAGGAVLMVQRRQRLA